MALIFEIKDPIPGQYTLNFPRSVGQYEYKAQAVSKEPIEFVYSFMYQESAAKRSPPFSIENPIKGDNILKFHCTKKTPIYIQYSRNNN